MRTAARPNGGEHGGEVVAAAEAVLDGIGQIKTRDVLCQRIARQARDVSPS